MKKKSILAIISSILVFSMLLVGCTNKDGDNSEGPKNEGDSKQDSEITFMIPEWGVPNDEMIDEFTDETGIKVNVETVAWDDIRNKISVAANGKKAPADVVEVDWAWVGEFESADWLEPLSLDQEDIDDIPSLESFTVGDKILGVPYANDFRIAYYNTEVYEKAGLEEPQTWDNVVEQMKLIKEKGILEYPYTLPLNASEGTNTAFIWITYLRDGKVFNDDNTLDKDNAMATLEFMNQMSKEELINPANTSSKDIDTYRQIASGEAAFLVGPTSFVGRVNDEEESKVVGKVMPISPPGKSGKAEQTMALVEGIGVTKYSENKEAAETFVKWYTSKETQAKLYEVNNTIPTRTSILEELIETDKLKNSGSMLETSKIVHTPFPNGVPSYYTEMSSSVSNAINKMVLGDLTPEQAFEEMNTKINELAK